MFWLIDTIIVRPIVNILFLIYNVVGDFGLAIIIFTVIVKLCMWPLVKKQLHQTKLMRKIQPELAEIKKNCKGNRQMESLQMMDLYKRHNIKPASSFITLLIQLPIFIALFAGISAVANPRPSGNTCGYTNVANCAYAPVRSLERVEEVASLQETYLADPELGYNFHPTLFGVVHLDTRASNVLAGDFSISTLIILGFALASAFVQYWIARQQMPSKKAQGRSFREMMQQAKDGKEPDQNDLNAIASRQMSTMMPIMMFVIMFSLPGALVFYYLLSNLITLVQQKVVLDRSEEEMEERADKVVLKELRNIEEAEIVKNKNGSKTKITRISAKPNKKRRK